MEKIIVHAINLPKRKDRRKHIIKQFLNREEFELKIVAPAVDENGARSLWQTIKLIVRNNLESDFVMICEDDHKFTPQYSKKELFILLNTAIKIKADLLSGGVSWVDGILKVRDGLYWVDQFSGTQFIIIFKKIYLKVLQTEFDKEPADTILSTLAKNKLVIFPFISIQKEFGYSDVTLFNNNKDRVKRLFLQSYQNFEILNHVSKYYLRDGKYIESYTELDNITIPTYIINLPERKDRLIHIKQQFLNRQEFDIRIVTGCKNKIGSFGLWKSIRKIIKLAIKNNDDVILIVKDDHCFTKHYSKEYFLKNVVEAHHQNTDYLSGGTSGFGIAVQITENRFWLHPCLATQFIVVYKKFFSKILEEPYDKTVIADLKLSDMTSNKMTFFPFISFQKDFGYSDITPANNKFSSGVGNMFSTAQKRLTKIKGAREKIQLLSESSG